MNAVPSQSTTVNEEDNSACVAAAAVTHITRGLRHLDFGEAYFKEKAADKTCIIIKVASEDNSADIGTRRVYLPLFNKLTYRLVVNHEERIYELVIYVKLLF